MSGRTKHPARRGYQKPGTGVKTGRVRSWALLAPAVLIGVSGLAAVSVLLARHGVESSYRRVEVVLDYDEVAALAESRGKSAPDLLARLQKVGVTGIAVNEETLPGMVDAGRASVLEGAGHLLLGVSYPQWAERVRRSLEAKWPSDQWEPGTDVPRTFEFGVPLLALKDIGVGWQAEQIAQVRAAKLTPVARPIDSARIDRRGLTYTLTQAKQAGMDRIMFAGKFVLGNPDLLPLTAELFRANDLTFYAVELDVQEGTDALTHLLKSAVVRTHSVADKEMLKLSPDAARRRFVRAVRERNVRCCFVHLFLDRAMDDPLDYNLSYVAALAKDLQDAGYPLGMAERFPRFTGGADARLVLALGAAGGLVLLVALIAPVSGPALILGTALATIAFCGLTAVSATAGRQIAAWVTCITFPTLAVVYVWRSIRRGGGGLRRHLAQSAGLFVAASLFSTLGGLIAAALLSDSAFMTKALQFRGIKLSQLVPVITVATVLVLRLSGTGCTWPEWWQGARRRLGDTWGTPFTVGYALIGVLVLGAGAYWIMRTGNQAASATLESERGLRDLLESLLVYRPRTKEFMLGHPALVLGAFLGLSRRRTFVVPLLVIAAVGQASLVNTFCHIHTPIAATLTRTGYGIALGLLIGLAACIVVTAARRWTGGRSSRHADEHLSSAQPTGGDTG